MPVGRYLFERGALMEFKSYIIIFVGILLIAVAVAGCSSSNSSTSSSASPTAATATPTPVPAIGSTLNMNSVMDLSHVHWYKYQTVPTGTAVDMGRGVTTTGAIMTEQWDFNVNYNGQNADQVTGTGTYPSNDYTGTTMVFLNHSNHKQLLSGNMTVMKNGNVIYKGDVTPNLLEFQSILDLTNNTYSGPHTVIYGGAETVTVPLGKYATTKYMYNGGYNLTIYMNNDVPIPIKVEAVSPSGTMYDVELMGWS